MKPQLIKLSDRFYFECQWFAVLCLGRGHNWVDFDFVKFYMEWDKVTASFEIEVAFLGFKARVKLPSPETEEHKVMVERHRDIVSGKAELVEVAPGLKMPMELLEAMNMARTMTMEREKKESDDTGA